jgi:hypothetical protein
MYRSPVLDQGQRSLPGRVRSANDHDAIAGAQLLAC